jgi:hypothetical protein
LSTARRRRSTRWRAAFAAAALLALPGCNAPTISPNDPAYNASGAPGAVAWQSPQNARVYRSLGRSTN